MKEFRYRLGAILLIVWSIPCMIGFFIRSIGLVSGSLIGMWIGVLLMYNGVKTLQLKEIIKNE